MRLSYPVWFRLGRVRGSPERASPRSSRKAITICLNSWPLSRRNRTKQKRMPRIKSPRLDDAEPRRRACIEQCRSGERIGMIADVSGIGALNHPDAGVMANRYNPHRDACEQLAHYVAVPQGINRDFFQASLFSYSRERSGMIGPLPGLAVSLNEQRFRWWTAVDGRAQLRREARRDR